MQAYVLSVQVFHTDFVTAATVKPALPGVVGALKPQTATLTTEKLSPNSPEIQISVGPNAGNTSLTIVVTVSESFDNPNVGGRGSTKRIASLDIDLKNQEIIWESGYYDAVKNCNRMEHLADGIGVVFGPPQPGDPPGMVNTVIQGSSTGVLNGLRIC